MRICEVEGCDKPFHAKGCCGKHYAQLREYGRILKRTRFDKNEIIKHRDYAEIVLYSGKLEQEEVAKAKIDLEDVEKAKNVRWHLLNHRYVYNRSKAAGGVLLHRFITNAPKGMDVDHINNNGLDNRKKNLRVCTHSQNCMNRKDVKGYYWDKSRKKWGAKVRVNYKHINLGRFKTKEEAKKARKDAEKKYFGEYANAA